MEEKQRVALWSLIGLVSIVFTVPWFLWRNDTVIAGLPVWLWWHIGWLGLCSIVFYGFTRRAWGIGIETGDERIDGSEQRG